MLFPHRLTAIAEVVRAHGIPLLYDASHVAGLVAEGRFQDPLREGADLVTFSTYKSFGGPPGGVIVTNDAALAERVSDAVYPALVANYDASRLRPARGRRARARALRRRVRRPVHRQRPGAGARRSRPRASTCSAPAAASPSPTTSRSTSPGGGTAAARRLAEGNILASEIGIPGDPAGGLRIGTQAITRQGFVEDDMAAIAAACAGALLHDRDVRQDVADLRRRHTGLRWCLTPEDLP